MSNGADTGKGFAQRFLFGQPEASNGADTSREFAQRFLFGQPEAGNGANTGKECTQRFLFGSRRQVMEQTLVKGSHSDSSSDSQRQVTEQLNSLVANLARRSINSA